jgi:hypothetical protein
MQKTNLELAHETAALIGCIEDNYSLFDGMDIDKSKLISESLATIQKNIAHLNSVYNSEMVEMKSVVEIAEERHRMTQEEFDSLTTHDSVEYDRMEQQVRNIDRKDGLVLLNISGWQNFDSCKLIRSL